MNKAKTFIKTIGGIVPILTCTVIGIIFIIGLTGCPEAEQMVKPVISTDEPPDTTTLPTDTAPPTTVGEVKEPEEPAQPTEEPTEPEPVVEQPTEPEEPVEEPVEPEGSTEPEEQHRS